jgi:putative addiction module component (TIGR02574 family)
MSSTEIFEQALELKPEEKITLVEYLLNSIDKPDKKIDDIWAREAERRLSAYRKGELEGIPMDKIFTKE